MREVVAVAVRVVLRSIQVGSKPGALGGLVPYLVDLAEKDLAGPVGLAERDLVGLEVWLVRSSRVFLASGVRYTLQLFLRPGLGFDRAGTAVLRGRERKKVSFSAE